MVTSAVIALLLAAPASDGASGELGQWRWATRAGLQWPGLKGVRFHLVREERWVHQTTLWSAASPRLRLTAGTVAASTDPNVRNRRHNVAARGNGFASLDYAIRPNLQLAIRGSARRLRSVLPAPTLQWRW